MLAKPLGVAGLYLELAASSFPLSLGERRTRSASEGKELLASEFGAGIGARDAKLAAATTILAHCTRCAAQIVAVVIILFIVSCANFRRHRKFLPP